MTNSHVQNCCPTGCQNMHLQPVKKIQAFSINSIISAAFHANSDDIFTKITRKFEPQQSQLSQNQKFI